MKRLLALAILLLSAPAAADEATVQATTLFNVGAQAYEAAQFGAAIQAFTEAYRLWPRPGILFSIAQVYRRQFYVEKQPFQLHEALRHYREYLAKVGEGGRSAEAVRAIAELEPLALKLGGADTPPPPPRRPTTQIMVSVQAKDATVVLDGGKPAPLPLFAEVKPGKHTVRVVAAGYFPEEREVQAGEGAVVALDLPLREEPGHLSLRARDGADVFVDDRAVAATPLARPLDLAPGRHFVAVTRRGYRPFSLDLEIGRGEARTLAVPLETSSQRTAAYVLAGVAAAGLVAGGVLAGVAVVEQGRAQSLDDRRRLEGGLSPSDLAQYGSYVGTRDDLRTAAGVAFGGAAAVGATAVLLAIFDLPVVRRAPRDEPARPAAPPGERPTDVTAGPVLGPGLVGAVVGVRF